MNLIKKIFLFVGAFELSLQINDREECSQKVLETARNTSFKADVAVRWSLGPEFDLTIDLFHPSQRITEEICNTIQKPSGGTCIEVVKSLVDEVHFLLFNELFSTLGDYLSCFGVASSQAYPHSAMFPQKINYIQDRAAEQGNGTICEVGFNIGHSAVAFLLASPGSRVVSFEFSPNTNQGIAFSTYAAWFVEQLFPGRFMMVVGDSKFSVQSFGMINNGLKCDLLYIDGGHLYEQAIADMENFQVMANEEDHLLMVDDIDGDQVASAWREETGTRGLNRRHASSPSSSTSTTFTETGGRLEALGEFTEQQNVTVGPGGELVACYHSTLSAVAWDRRAAAAAGERAGGDGGGGGAPRRRGPRLSLAAGAAWVPGAWRRSRCEGGAAAAAVAEAGRQLPEGARTLSDHERLLLPSATAAAAAAAAAAGESPPAPAAEAAAAALLREGDTYLHSTRVGLARYRPKPQ